MAYQIQDFVDLIAQLRNPQGGCPWDLAQTYHSMIRCLTEESYEVIDAIEQNNDQNLKEELGDLLLQVVFLSQLAKEDGKFTFDEVVHSVSEKIIHRHPHVFGENHATSPQEALQNWNAVKATENEKKGYQSILDNVPLAFPALLRAEKLQKRCAKVGFDWQNVHPVLEKVEEELQEVWCEIQQNSPNQEKISEEIGDLLFAVVNLSRHLGCNPEESLRKANLKFEHRFRQVEQRLKQQDKNFTDTSLSEMDILWNEVKQLETNKK